MDRICASGGIHGRLDLLDRGPDPFGVIERRRKMAIAPKRRPRDGVGSG